MYSHAFRYRSAYVLNPPPSHVIASVLRAANALSCRAIVQFSEKLLQEIWSPDLSRVSGTPLPYAQETILLARELGLPAVLKRALYELLRDGDSRDDLSRGDLHRIHTAHGELQMAWAGFIWNMPNSHAFQCHNRQGGSLTCAAAIDRDRFQTWRDLLEEHELFAPNDPLDGLRRLAELDWASCGCCAGCVASRREIFAKKREELWVKLDSWLDL